jgi:glycosyltransferase involved in cell wall biosynthesis
MARIHIICGRYYDFENNRYTVGGIQTYNTALRSVAEEMNIECVLYQPHTLEDEHVSGQTRIVQVAVSSGKTDIQKVRALLNECKKNFDVEHDILLFNTDSRIQKNFAKKSIAIQHGIFWDIPRHENKSTLFNSIYTFNRSREAFKILQRLRNVGNIVCVDYNFPNWYRSVAAYEAVNMKVIPNFTQIAPKAEKPKDRINIMFARRFEIYRGTRLFANAISRVLSEHDNVYVTVAGSGPDEKYIKDKLSVFAERVTFTKYTSDESLAIHADKHIAVVPTVGSEGTSLSLLEAMSAQCAVVCTNVGGMTNIVIDGYNGLMISPKENELYEAITKLINDEALRVRLSERAYETVQEGFSYEKWKESWKKVLTDIMSE